MRRRDERFRHFVDHYRPFVDAFVTRRVEAHDVDDLVAEVFSVAWRRRHEVPDDALPWLYRTARNVVGTRYRSRDRLAALRDKIAAVPMESPDDPGEATAQRARLVAGFEALSPDDRELLLLVAWEGLTPAEIGEMYDISPGAASVRIHRARRRMASAMVDDEPGPHERGRIEDAR